MGLGGQAGDGEEEEEGMLRLDAEKAEKARILERANLRHRNTTAWSKRILRRGALAIDEGSGPPLLHVAVFVRARASARVCVRVFVCVAKCLSVWRH